MITIDTSPNRELDNLFEIVSEEEIYTFAKKYAYQNESFGNALLKQFAAKLPSTEIAPNKEEFLKEIDCCFTHVVIVPYNRYYNEPGFEELDWEEVGKDIARVVKRLELLLDAGHEELAAELSVILLQKIDAEFEDYLFDDYDFNSDNFHAEETLSIIERAISSGRMSKNSQLAVADALSDMDGALAFDHIDFKEIVNAVRNSLLTDDERIAIRKMAFENATEEYIKESVAEELWDYLMQLHREEEAVSLFQKNKKINRLRTRYVKWLDAKGEWKEALNVLNEGLAQQEGWGRNRSWEEYKLALYEKLADHSNMIKQAQKLFLDTNFSLDYYRKLKKWVEKEQWEMTLRAMLKKHNTLWGHHDNLSQIYVSEGWYEDLFLQLKSEHGNTLAPFCKYARYFDEKQQTELLSLIEKDYLGRFVSSRPRKEYHELTSDLIALKKSCPLGKQTATHIVEKCRNMYPNRPAMLDELKRFY